MRNPCSERGEGERHAGDSEPGHGSQTLQQRSGLPPGGDEGTKRPEQVGHRVVRGDGGEPPGEQLLGYHGIGEEEQREEDDVAGIDGGGTAGLQRNGIRKRP